MKITSTRRDEILRERDEYNAQRDAAQEQYNRERRSYEEDTNAVIDPVKSWLEAQLSHYTVLQFDVSAERNWRWDNRGISIRIRCNERLLHDDSSALSWNFDVQLSKDGEVQKETGSWSGLQATTAAQLKSLRQSVSALEFLNDIDWVDVLDKQLPEYENYIKTRVPSNRDSEFDKMLREEDLKSLIGTNTFIKVNNFESSGYWGSIVWVRLIRETPAQYVVNIASQSAIQRYKENPEEWAKYSQYTQRVKKTNISPVLEHGSFVTEEV